MMRKCLGITVFMVAAMALLNLESCARSQKLIGITVQPGSFTFLTPDSTLTANFTALGTDIPQLLTLTSGGTVSPSVNGGCGVVNVSASSTLDTEAGGIAIGYATVTVNNPAISYCPGGTTEPILAVVPESTTTTGNTVTSSPAGINCPAQTCGAPFPAGTAVTLTALPSSNFVSWSTTCPGATFNVCVVDVTADVSVTAIFQ